MMLGPLSSFVFLLLLVISATAQAFDPDAFGKSVNEKIDRVQRAERAAGMSVAVLDARGGKWLRSLGQRDRDAALPMLNATPYQVGDFSKVLTTLAVLQLTAQGRIALDEPVARYLPAFAPTSRYEALPPVRVRDLLTHHSGLPSATWHGMFQEPGAAPSGALEVSALHLAQPTRQIYSYSNVGFEVAGAVVAAVSGVPLTQWVEAQIFKPLDLAHSSYSVPSDGARGHRKAKRLPQLIARDTAALGAWMSASDVLKLLQTLLDPASLENKLGIPPALRDEMLRVQNADVAFDLDNRTGLAWQLTNTGRHRVASIARMNIGVPGFRGVVLLAPKEGLAAFVLANASGSGESMTELAQQIFDELVRVERGLDPPDYSERVPERVQWPKVARADKMSPRYATALGLVRFDAADEDHYVMDFLGYKLHATKREDGWYQLRYRLLGFMPLSLGIFNKVLVAPAQINGESVLLAYFEGGRFLFGQALPATELPARAKALLGRYTLLNSDGLSTELKIDKVRLSERDGLLLVNYKIPAGLIDFEATVPLLPLPDGNWVVPGLGSNMGDVLTLLPRDGAPAWQFSGYQFRRSE
jgi:CubicO group peptidase (beta-lactamase class C family)